MTWNVKQIDGNTPRDRRILVWTTVWDRNGEWRGAKWNSEPGLNNPKPHWCIEGAGGTRSEFIANPPLAWMELPPQGYLARCEHCGHTSPVSVWPAAVSSFGNDQLCPACGEITEADPAPESVSAEGETRP